MTDQEFQQLLSTLGMAGAAIPGVGWIAPVVSGLGNLAGRLFSGPQRDRTDWNALREALIASNNRATEGQASLVGQRAAQVGAGANLSGGALAGSINDATSGVYQTGQNQLSNALFNLDLQKAGIQSEDRNAQRAYMGDLIGGTASDIAGGIGQYTAGQMRQKNFDNMIAGLKKAYGPQPTAQTVQPAQASPQFAPAYAPPARAPYPYRKNRSLWGEPIQNDRQPMGWN